MEDSNPYVYKVLEQVQPGLSLSEDSLKFISIFLEGILYELIRLYQINLSLQDVVKLVFTGELCKYALNEGYKAIKKFSGIYDRKPKVKEEMFQSFKLLEIRSKKSGLTLLTLVTEKALRGFGYEIFSDYFVVFLTTILEYLTAEILELSGSITRYNNRIVIIPDDIIKAINTDEELSKPLNKIFTKNGQEWTNYFINYTKPNSLNIKKEGLLKFIEYVKYNKNGNDTIPIINEFDHDNSDIIPIEMIQLEKDKIEFESTYINERNELEKEEQKMMEEYENEDCTEEEIFTFTKSELEEYRRKVIEEYIESQNNEHCRKKKH